MHLEFKITKEGIGLTDAQLDECSAFACSVVLHRHRDELEEERLQQIERRLKWVKAQLCQGATVGEDEQA